VHRRACQRVRSVDASESDTVCVSKTYTHVNLTLTIASCGARCQGCPEHAKANATRGCNGQAWCVRWRHNALAMVWDKGVLAAVTRLTEMSNLTWRHAAFGWDGGGRESRCVSARRWMQQASCTWC